MLILKFAMHQSIGHLWICLWGEAGWACKLGITVACVEDSWHSWPFRLTQHRIVNQLFRSSSLSMVKRTIDWNNWVDEGHALVASSLVSDRKGYETIAIDQMLYFISCCGFVFPTSIFIDRTCSFQTDQFLSSFAIVLVRSRDMLHHAFCLQFHTIFTSWVGPGKSCLLHRPKLCTPQRWASEGHRCIVSNVGNPR